MSNRVRYFCMGNVLVVGLIERMAERVYEIDIIVRKQPEIKFEEMV